MMSTGFDTRTKIPSKPLATTDSTIDFIICMLGVSIASLSWLLLSMGAEAVMMTMSASLQSLYSPARTEIFLFMK